MFFPELSKKIANLFPKIRRLVVLVMYLKVCKPRFT